MDGEFLKKLRVLGLVEGTSTLVLFGVAMPLKYLAGVPMAVTVVGPIHGLLFLALAMGCLIAVERVPIGWKLGVAGVLSAIIPGGPFVLDVWLRRIQAEAAAEAATAAGDAA